MRIGLFQDWKRLEPDIVRRLFKCPAEVETRRICVESGLLAGERCPVTAEG